MQETSIFSSSSSYTVSSPHRNYQESLKRIEWFFRLLIVENYEMHVDLTAPVQGKDSAVALFAECLQVLLVFSKIH